MPTFGQLISQARRKRQLSQKQLASIIQKEDGKPITPQYLNDIERDRRTPSDYVSDQLARALDLDSDYLFFLRGEFPADIKQSSIDQSSFGQAMRLFRKTLEKTKDDMGSR